MKLTTLLLIAAAAVAGIVALIAPASGRAHENAAPIYGVKILPEYRDWRLISVAHEEGTVLGWDVNLLRKVSLSRKLPDQS